VAASGGERGVLEELARASSGRVAPCPLDATDAGATRDTVAAIERVAGPVMLAVLMTGVWSSPQSGPLGGREISETLSVGVTGVVNALLALLPAMGARGRGRIAIVATPARDPAPSLAGSASTAALVHLAGALKADCTRAGLDLRVVHPGAVPPKTADETVQRLLAALAGKTFEIALNREPLWRASLRRFAPRRLYPRFFRRADTA
jgi:NAD(P)-dependent dehydrogenase (short-subunit alcohol dehydrogenase family)